MSFSLYPILFFFSVSAYADLETAHGWLEKQGGTNQSLASFPELQNRLRKFPYPDVTEVDLIDLLK